MVRFALAEFEDLLLQGGLYGAVRAVLYDIPQSTQHFYAILEWYNPATCTFFTPIGEMGLALHEMYEVSGLIIGDAPYEEYVPSNRGAIFAEEERSSSVRELLGGTVSLSHLWVGDRMEE